MTEPIKIEPVHSMAVSFLKGRNMSSLLSVVAFFVAQWGINLDDATQELIIQALVGITSGGIILLNTLSKFREQAREKSRRSAVQAGKEYFAAKKQ